MLALIVDLTCGINHYIPIVILHLPHFFLHILFGILLWGSLFILPSIFIYLIIFIILLDIFALHSLDYNIVLSYLLFLDCSSFVIGSFSTSSFSLWCEPLPPLPPLFRTYFWNCEILKAHILFFLLKWISHFIRDPWIILLNNWHLKLRVSCSPCTPLSDFTLYYFEKKSILW